MELRKSHMDIGKLYFWTATKNNWNELLEKDELKEVIVSSLKYLVTNKKYKFMHLSSCRIACIYLPAGRQVWQLMKMNGKESVARTNE